MIEIHAYHGWGFDDKFWDNLRNEIPLDVLFKAANRGYFGGAFDPDFSEASDTKIIFTHSFGLHWCTNEKLHKADVLIIFNGFNDFLPIDFFERRKELKVLKRMNDQFKKTPEVVLNEFYKNCFYPQKAENKSAEWINFSLLTMDLLALKKSNIKITNPNLRIISLSGFEDRIVNHIKTKQLQEISKNMESQIFKGYGHALPMVNSSDCWSYLCTVLPIFVGYANKD